MTLKDQIRDSLEMLAAAKETGGTLPPAFLWQIERTLEKCLREIEGRRAA